MEDIKKIQDELFLLLKQRESDKAKKILMKHPELTNMRRTDDYEHEVSTPLIEACRYGEFTLIFINLTINMVHWKTTDTSVQVSIGAMVNYAYNTVVSLHLFQSDNLNPLLLTDLLHLP